MSNIYGKCSKGKATRLHSLLVRSRGECEAHTAHRAGAIDWHPQCSGGLECSHIISRSYAWTRTDLDNALCLCSGAHFHVGTFQKHHLELVAHVYGAGHWDVLYRRANEGVNRKFDWDDRAETLLALSITRGLA